MCVLCVFACLVFILYTFLYTMKLNGFVRSTIVWRRASAVTALTAAAGANGVNRKTPSMVGLPPGAALGVPLSLIQNVFTNLHYGYDITTWQSVGLQFLIGYYTYGKDRYKDALEYKEAPYPITKEKAAVYRELLENAGFYDMSYYVAFELIGLLMLVQFADVNIVPFLLLLYSCEYYKDLKRVLPLAKPVYVSTMWTLSTVVLPCVLHDHDFSILQDMGAYLPCFLTMFALTNVADLRDVEADALNGIETLPVAYGKVSTATVAQVALLFSSLVFGLSPHYLDRPFVNALVELHNAAVSGYLIYSTFEDSTLEDSTLNDM